MDTPEGSVTLSLPMSEGEIDRWLDALTNGLRFVPVAGTDWLLYRALRIGDAWVMAAAQKELAERPIDKVAMPEEVDHHRGIVLRPLPGPRGTTLLTLTCLRPELRAYYDALVAQIRTQLEGKAVGEAQTRARSEKHPGGRPRRYTNRAELMAQLRIAIRANRTFPAKVMIARALDISEDTLTRTLTRFGVTEDELRELAKDQDEEV